MIFLFKKRNEIKIKKLKLFQYIVLYTKKEKRI